MSKPAYNTNDIAKVKDVDPELTGQAKQWMEALNGESYPDFFEDIRDGVELCKLVNVIKPGTIAEKKFKKSKVVFVARTNIQLFIMACKKLGIPETDCIETRDLFDQQNLAAVLINIEALSKIAHKHGWTGPFMTNKTYAEKNKREFSAEVLAKSKSAVPAMNKGGIAYENKGMDSAGIVKTSKDMQKPSQVQSVWAKGGIAYENKGMDGMGIVKTSKDMQNPSNVQGVWAKGGIAYEKDGMDSAGIVKTKKDMQNPSQVQGVWAQGGIAYEKDGMDSAGIVKTKKDMQNPSQVQGVWQQGANAKESSNFDSHGIIKKADD